MCEVKRMSTKIWIGCNKKNISIFHITTSTTKRFWLFADSVFEMGDRLVARVKKNIDMFPNIPNTQKHDSPRGLASPSDRLGSPGANELSRKSARAEVRNNGK